MEMNQPAPSQAMPTQAAIANPPATATSEADAALFNKLFSVTDKDGSGDVNLQEFGDLLEFSRQQSGMGTGPIQGSVVDQILNQVDTSGDGTLSQEEFAAFLDSAMSEGTSSTASPAATQESAEPTGSAVPGSMDFLATNITPIAQTKSEGNKPAN
jgi:Ca2+-binding EF-hand superfamily protein